MTIDSIKGAICGFFNGSSDFDIPFVKAPTNHAAPKGNYIAVKVENVAQDGNMMHPNKGEGLHFMNIATVAFIEVEGDGDNLRKVRNALQMDAFRAVAATNDFTVLDVGQIIEIPTYDGEFYVRQWRLTCRVNFNDEVNENPAKIATVSPITLTGA